MRVKVHYLTQIRRSAGCSTEVVESANAVTLHELLHVLAGRHDPAFRELVLDDAGEPRKSLLFFVDDEPADMSRALREGNAVLILAPMAGG